MKRSKAFQSVSRSLFAGRSSRLVTVSGSSPAMTQESAPPGPPTSTSSSHVDGGRRRPHAGEVQGGLRAKGVMLHAGEAPEAPGTGTSGLSGMRDTVRLVEGEKRFISTSHPAEAEAEAEAALAEVAVAAAVEAEVAAEAAMEARRLRLTSPPAAGSAASAGATEGSAE